MKSFLVHIASLAVMVHMTFGCNMHHGHGSANACVAQHAISTCCASTVAELADDGHGHDTHEHVDHDGEIPESDSTSDAEKPTHGNNHLCCQDDSCNVIKLSRFVYVPLECFTAYLGGAEDAAIAKASSYTGFSVNPFPDRDCSAPQMRSHLLLGVQLI